MSRLTGIFDTLSKRSSLRLISEIVYQSGAKPPIAAMTPPPAGINTDVVFGADLIFDKRLSRAMWLDFLPQALENWLFVPKAGPGDRYNRA